jgi:hypothetical protein
MNIQLDGDKVELGTLVSIAGGMGILLGTALVLALLDLPAGWFLPALVALWAVWWAITWASKRVHFGLIDRDDDGLAER